MIDNMPDEMWIDEVGTVLNVWKGYEKPDSAISYTRTDIHEALKKRTDLVDGELMIASQYGYERCRGKMLEDITKHKIVMEGMRKALEFYRDIPYEPSNGKYEVIEDDYGRIAKHPLHNYLMFSYIFQHLTTTSLVTILGSNH